MLLSERVWCWGHFAFKSYNILWVGFAYLTDLKTNLYILIVMSGLLVEQNVTSAGRCCLMGNQIFVAWIERLNYDQLILQQIKSRTCTYSGESATSKEFLKHIRGYNSRFDFTSLGTRNAEILGRGSPTFKLSGRIHHYIVANLKCAPKTENPIV